MTLPVIDEDGDLCTTSVEFDMRAAANAWHDAGGGYNYPFQECSFFEQIDFMSASWIVQDFLNTQLIGWGEYGDRLSSDSAGTWIEPDIGVG